MLGWYDRDNSCSVTIWCMGTLRVIKDWKEVNEEEKYDLVVLMYVIIWVLILTLRSQDIPWPVRLEIESLFIGGFLIFSTMMSPSISDVMW